MGHFDIKMFVMTIPMSGWAIDFGVLSLSPFKIEETGGKMQKVDLQTLDKIKSNLFFY